MRDSRKRRLHSAIVATAAPTPPFQDDTTPPWRWRGIGIGIAASALIGGLILRVAAPSPMWLDEALSVNLASLGFTDLVEALRNDGHPALYYLLLGWWMDAFGESDLAARSLSAVFSALTVPVVWMVARRQGRGTAGVAALLALTSPYLLRYSTEARMYALFALLVAAGWWAVEAALARPDRLRLFVVFVTTAALIHTHYWAFWVISAALVVLAWPTRGTDPAARRPMIRVGGAMITGSATFVVWLDVFLDQLSSTGTPWADRARPAEVAVETIQAIGGNNRFEGELLGVILVILVLLGGLASSVDGDRLELRFGPGPLHGAAAMVLLSLGIGGGVAWVTAGAFEARYAAVALAFMLVLAARGVAMLPRPVADVVLSIVVLFGLAVGIDEARRDRTQAADVAAAIDMGWQTGDVVAFCPDQVGPATLRALDAPAATHAYPRGDGHFVDWSDYADVIGASPPEQFVDSIVQIADGADVWMVFGLGYKSLGNRCETIVELLGRTHLPNRMISPSEAFEPMLLTRFEPKP